MISSRIVVSIAVLSLFPLAVGPTTGCTSASEVHAMAAPNAQFDRYRTFTFETTTASPDLYRSSPQTADVRGQIREEVGEVLSSRGYLAVNAPEADLVVRVEAGRREHPPEGKAVPPEQVQDEYSGWLDNEDQDRVEGAFVIDVFDSRTKRLLWHGSARAVIDPVQVDRPRLERAVQRVMESFPTRVGQ